MSKISVIFDKAIGMYVVRNDKKEWLGKFVNAKDAIEYGRISQAHAQRDVATDVEYKKAKEQAAKNAKRAATSAGYASLSVNAEYYQLRRRAIVALFDIGFNKADIGRIFNVSSIRIFEILGSEAAKLRKLETYDFLGEAPPLRVMDMCRDLGVTCLEELKSLTMGEMLHQPNFGRKSLQWLKDEGLWP